MRGFRVIAGLLLGGLLLAAHPALACPPPPPPPRLAGESDADYAARVQQIYEQAQIAARNRQLAHERDILALTEQVVLARVIRVEHLRDATRRYAGQPFPYTRLTFVVDRVIRGTARPRRFTLRHDPPQTDCDWGGHPASLDGLARGDRILVFASAGALGTGTFREALRESTSLDPATQALFARAVQAR